jgi:hypothetical protein
MREFNVPSGNPGARSLVQGATGEQFVGESVEGVGILLIFVAADVEVFFELVTGGTSKAGIEVLKAFEDGLDRVFVAIDGAGSNARLTGKGLGTYLLLVPGVGLGNKEAELQQVAGAQVFVVGGTESP